MKRMCLPIAAVLLAFGHAPHQPASAQVSPYPFCIQGPDNPGWTGCSFSSLQACQEAASGIEADCLANPWYQPANPPAPAASQDSAASGPIQIGPPPGAARD